MYGPLFLKFQCQIDLLIEDNRFSSYSGEDSLMLAREID